MVPWYANNSTQKQQQQVAPAMAAVASLPDAASSSSSSAATASAAVETCLNGPETEPVLYNPHHGTKAKPTYDADPRCRSCHSTEIVTDWKQGDRICTNCGTVVEEHILDDRPEWRDFNDVDDIIKGLPNGARSGLVVVDESKYLGGLQPTRLSKHVFGGDNSLLKLSKNLKATNKRLDRFMEKQHKKALQDAKVDRAIRLKHGFSTSSTEIRPEMEQLILQEEEDAHRMHAALYAEKWSLDRAILLHGGSSSDAHHHHHHDAGYSPEQQQEEREDLVGRMDSTLRKASKDIYTAYIMLLNGAQKLHLPNQVRMEVVHRLVRFVTLRDGFFVKGVSSRLSSSSKEVASAQRKKAAEQLREYNKLKQMGALNAAILFLTARSLGWTRSAAEVCASLEPPPTFAEHPQPFVKTKHCSRAVTEIKAAFPEYGWIKEGTLSQNGDTGDKAAASSASSLSNANNDNDALATLNFADHSLRRLELPPVADACARTLLLHCREQQLQLGQNSGTKLSTICAAVTYFVCSAGTIMQRLARQMAQQQKQLESSTTSNKRASYTNRPSAALDSPTKRRKMSDSSWDVSNSKASSLVDGTDSSDDSMASKPKDDGDNDEPFDVFSHAPVVEDLTGKHKYEMRRMWDAWSEQMKWTRSVAEVEQSCGVSRNVILEFYKTQLYPQREELLRVLGNAVSNHNNKKEEGDTGDSLSSTKLTLLQDTPLSRILLIHISTAAPLMNAK